MENEHVVLGFDPSLTSSGYCYQYAGETRRGTLKPKGIIGVRRLAWFRDQFHELVCRSMNRSGELPVYLDMLVIEGYSMGSRNGRVFNIGELGGIIRLSAFDYKIPTLTVPPSSLKMFATGKGNADKKQVIAAVQRVWDEPVRQDDEADAFVLMKMGLAYLQKHQLRSKVRRAALEKCEFHRP